MVVAGMQSSPALMLGGLRRLRHLELRVVVEAATAGHHLSLCEHGHRVSRAVPHSEQGRWRIRRELFPATALFPGPRVDGTSVWRSWKARAVAANPVST